MKNRLFPICLFLLSFIAFSCTQSTEQNNQATEQNEKAEITNKKMLRHVVLLKFKESSTAEEVKTVEDAFRKLKDEIPEIKGFEWGINNSPEGLDDGFTHAFLVSFTSEEDRAIYLPHPKHKAFVEILRPHLEKALVVDYWAEK